MSRDATREPRARLSRPAREGQLLAVAERLFAARGYEATSIEDIAHAAGVTRPVVYDHFADKGDVFVACVARIRARLEADVAATMARERPTDLRGLFAAGGEVLFSMLENDRARWLLMFTTPVALTDRLTALRQGTVVELLRMGLTLAPEVDPATANAFAHAVAGVGEQIGRWWITNPDVPRERVVGFYTDFLTSGLASLDG